VLCSVTRAAIGLFLLSGTLADRYGPWHETWVLVESCNKPDSGCGERETGSKNTEKSREAVASPASSIVIRQIHGRLSGSQCDFIELYNRGVTVASLDGHSLQMASTGNANGTLGDTATTRAALPDVVLWPGQSLADVERRN
jgi:hypothetical protein